MVVYISLVKRLQWFKVICILCIHTGSCSLHIYRGSTNVAAIDMICYLFCILKEISCAIKPQILFIVDGLVWIWPWHISGSECKLNFDHYMKELMSCTTWMYTVLCALSNVRGPIHFLLTCSVARTIMFFFWRQKSRSRQQQVFDLRLSWFIWHVCLRLSAKMKDVDLTSLMSGFQLPILFSTLD